MSNEQSGLWPWFAQRLTGIYLIFGMSVHLVKIHVIDKHVDYALVAGKLANAGWLIFDFTLLVVCIYHGFNGIWQVALDYNPKAGLRKALVYAIWFVAVGFTVFGLLALAAFRQVPPHLMAWG